MADVDTYSDDRRSGAYGMEHTLGWITALTAVALGVIGLLVGFGVLGGTEQGVNLDDATGAGAEGASNWLQGALWLLPAIAVALVSRALHSADHHERSGFADSASESESTDGMFGLEHMLAYVAAAWTIASSALALLVGFDVFDRGNVAEDGIMWGIYSIVPAVLTNTLHAVRHHQHTTVTQVERRTEVRPPGGIATRSR